MRKLLAFLTAVAISAVLSLPASAGWNIKQNADGSADWVNGFSDTSRIGAIYLNAEITDVSTAQTIAIVIPITAAKVTYIQSVLDGAITTASATIDFWHGNTTGTIGDEISNGTGKMTITEVAGSDETGDVDTFTPTKTNTLEKNATIYIHTDGASTTTTAIRFTITIEPKR